MANGKQLPEFQVLRDRAQQRARVAGQEAGGAINRRFAALGGLQSGAAIKTAQVAREQAQRVGEEQIGQLDLAEAATQRQQEQVKEQRDFQAGEAFKGREFAAKESGLGRELQREGLAFQRESKLAELGLAERELSLNEDIAGFNKQIALAEQGKPTDIFGQLLGPEYSLSKLTNPKSVGGIAGNKNVIRQGFSSVF